jgi:DNA-binding MarR family transcriptional regulator
MLPESTTKEFSILSYLDQNSDATQRQLSEHVGVSLGTINILLKRMVKKGLLKIERLQPNSVKYFLTPAGIANKLERTYGYIVRTYRELMEYQQRIVSLVHTLQKKYPKRKISFYGPKDEIYLLVEGIINSCELEVELKAECPEHEPLINMQQKEGIVLVWRSEDEEQLSKQGYTSENLLKVLV